MIVMLGDEEGEIDNPHRLIQAGMLRRQYHIGGVQFGEPIDKLCALVARTRRSAIPIRPDCDQPRGSSDSSDRLHASRALF